MTGAVAGRRRLSFLFAAGRACFRIDRRRVAMPVIVVMPVVVVVAMRVVMPMVVAVRRTVIVKSPRLGIVGGRVRAHSFLATKFWGLTPRCRPAASDGFPVGTKPRHADTGQCLAHF